MIIAHNLSALQADNWLKKINNNNVKSMNKLSSGYRINKASDDSAGLTISEKMRGQIRGLVQAQANIQDGISLIQTADGAISEIQGINQRMRELCIQGANDTLNNDDRENIQKELDQLKGELGSIADQTEFNTRKLLDGSIENTGALKTAMGLEWKATIAAPKQLMSMTATPDGGVIVGGTSDNNTSPYDPAYDQSPYLAKLNSQGDIEWQLKIPKDGDYNMIYDIKQINNSDEYILTSRSNSGGFNKNIFYKIDGSGNILSKLDYGQDNYSFCINENADGTFVETGNEGGDYFVRTYDSNMNPTGYQIISQGTYQFQAGMDIKQTSDGGYILAGIEYKAANNYGLVAKLNSDLSLAWEASVPNDRFSSVYELSSGNFMVLGSDLYQFDPSGTYFVMNSDITYQMNSYLYSHPYILQTPELNFLVASSTDTASVNNKLVKVDESGNEIWNLPINDNFHLAAFTQTSDGDFIVMGDNQVYKFTSETYQSSDKNLYIQIGANSAQSLTINIDSMKPQSLGYSNGYPSVIPRDRADLSINKIDRAINKISSNRNHLGSLQNRLEHLLNSNSSYEENLQNSESRIRDVDIAKEMMEYKKNYILEQSNQAMLAQSNKLTQNVLELLGR